jgi:hypothetical protein
VFRALRLGLRTTPGGSCVAALVATLWLAPPARAQNNPCDLPGEEPDIIVGDIFDTNRYGSQNGITAFSFGTESCNLGTCWANWLGWTPDHPVIAQNMYRLKDGRFEQIGQSWLKHGFATLDGALCALDCIPGGGSHLGVHCSDPYWADLNGDQTGLGPKFEVDPKTGVHLHPFTAEGQTGIPLYKRLQVRNDDLDPALNAGALYFLEGQYVAADDAAAGNNWNNNSYRRILVSGGGGVFDISLTDETQREQHAINAWRAADPTVVVRRFGDFLGAVRVTDLGGGTWHYEYAVQNVISDRGAQAFRVPLPHNALVTNVGFHDVDYHSGEPYAGDDWTVTLENGAGANSITWSTTPHAVDPDANALRWGTLYNFRFDLSAGAVNGPASLTYFAPGTPSETAWATRVPNRCGDEFCESPETPAGCPADCATTGSGAGRVPDGDSAPGPQLQVERDMLTGELTLSWGDSCLATDTDYEIYEGVLRDFTSHRWRLCSTGSLPGATLAPDAGSAYYLVVPTNGAQEGSYGVDGNDVPRPAAHSPCRPQQLATCP